MAQSQALQPQEKQELVSRDEKTVPVRYFVPTTDILETEDALTVVMEVPGATEAIDIEVENDVLKIEAQDRSLEIRGNGAALHRIQCRAFRPVVHAVEQDRPTADQRQTR